MHRFDQQVYNGALWLPRSVRPALDSEGWERLQETAARPVSAPRHSEPQQQEQQQQ
jgi:hypothetical protein